MKIIYYALGQVQRWSHMLVVGCTNSLLNVLLLLMGTLDRTLLIRPVKLLLELAGDLIDSTIREMVMKENLCVDLFYVLTLKEAEESY
jgi:hypothetical protein